MDVKKLLPFTVKIPLLLILLVLSTGTSTWTDSAPALLTANAQYSASSYRQCPNAPFVVPAEYVHASYGGTTSWPHPGVDFTGRTTDPNKARQPTSSACPENGVWDLGVPGEAPVYAAYDGFVDGFHYAQDGTLIGIYIRHVNVPVSGRTEPIVCTYYEHMGNANTGGSTIFPKFHSWNAPVQKGEQLGWIGNKSASGSTFAHLHFGVGIGLYGSHCNRPYDLPWYTDPSPFLGFNVNQDNGAPRYCYSVSCPSPCCCSSLAVSGGYETNTVTDFTFVAPLVGPVEAMSTLSIMPITESLPVPFITPTVQTPIQGEATISQRTPPASANYQIPKSVMGAGGGAKTSTSYILQGTNGQVMGVGQRESNSYILQSGYWHDAMALSRWLVYLPVVLK